MQTILDLYSIDLETIMLVINWLDTADASISTVGTFQSNTQWQVVCIYRTIYRVLWTRYWKSLLQKCGHNLTHNHHLIHFIQIYIQLFKNNKYQKPLAQCKVSSTDHMSENDQQVFRTAFWHLQWALTTIEQYKSFSKEHI